MNPIEFFLGIFRGLFKNKESQIHPDPAAKIITAKEAKAIFDAKKEGKPGVAEGLKKGLEEALEHSRGNIELKEVTRTLMKTNQRGIDLIKSFEGLELKAYPDPGTGGDPWTIGYGHTGPEVKKGLVITAQQAEDYLRKDLEKFESKLMGMLTAPVNENQWAALISFAYNCGPENLRTSTLLRLVNAKDYAGAAEQFLRWNKAAGKVLDGLTRRRQAERALFLS
jgi:lysozyme